MTASFTSRLGLYKVNPGTGELVDPVKLNNSMDRLDSAVGAGGMTAAARAALTSTTAFDGQMVRETDTRKLYVRNNTQGVWEQMLVSVGGLVDIDSTGKILFGTGGDTNLYRAGTNVLKTDDQFQPAGGLFVSNGAHKLMTQSNDFQLAANYTMTTTVTDLPGMTWTFTTIRANALAVVTWHGDFTTTGSGVGTGIMRLAIDGADLINPQALFNGGNTTAGARATVGNQAHITLGAAGSHTIKARAQESATLGMILQSLHTSMNIQIFE